MSTDESRLIRRFKSLSHIYVNIEHFSPVLPVTSFMTMMNQNRGSCVNTVKSMGYHLKKKSKRFYHILAFFSSPTFDTIKKCHVEFPIL